MLLTLISTHQSTINTGAWHITFAFLYFAKEKTSPVVPESHPTRPELFTEKAEVGPGKAHSSQQMGPALAPGKSSVARCLSGSPLSVQTEAGSFSYTVLVTGLLDQAL